MMDIEYCSFLKVMGPLHEIPFVGKDLNRWVFPICLCLMVLFTFVDGYNRLTRLFTGNKNQYGLNDSETKDKIMDGQFIISKFRENKFLS